MQPQLLLPALLVTLLVTARPEKKARKRKEAEKAANKKALDKARRQTRVNIGVAFVETTEGFEVMLRLLSFCWTEESRPTTAAPSTGAVIGGILGALIVIGIIVGVIFFIRKRQDDVEGPPKHKPPPPVKASRSTEMLNKPSAPPMPTETAPLSPGEVYYEPTGREPVTNLDEETTGALNGGAPPVLDNSAKYDNVNELTADGHHSNDLDPSSHEQQPPTANISRGESFVSPAMYV